MVFVLIDYGVDKYEIGTGFGHFAIATEDVNAILLFTIYYDLTGLVSLDSSSCEILGL